MQFAARNLSCIAILLLVAAILAGAAVLFLQKSTNAQGGLSNVFGWAWSSNIGWINFAGATGDGGSSYGVHVDALGNLSGWAWSSNIGWITFNATDVADCPGTPGNFLCPAHIDIGTGDVSGWARACAGTRDGGCALGGRTDGWDGWISLRGAAPNHGVTTAGTNPRNWSGFAWGGEVVGWISMRGSGYGVSDNIAPPPLVVACTGDPSPAATNHPVTWSSLVGGGTAPYTYAWTGDNGLSGATATVTKSYASVGTKNARLTLTDASTPSQVLRADCAVTVVREREVNPSSARFREIIPE